MQVPDPIVTVIVRAVCDRARSRAARSVTSCSAVARVCGPSRMSLEKSARTRTASGALSGRIARWSIPRARSCRRRAVTWAVDMVGGEPALLLALLVNHGQEVLYIPGRMVNRAQ